MIDKDNSRFRNVLVNYGAQKYTMRFPKDFSDDMVKQKVGEYFTSKSADIKNEMPVMVDSGVEKKRLDVVDELKTNVKVQWNILKGLATIATTAPEKFVGIPLEAYGEQMALSKDFETASKGVFNLLNKDLSLLERLRAIEPGAPIKEFSRASLRKLAEKTTIDYRIAYAGRKITNISRSINTALGLNRPTGVSDELYASFIRRVEDDEIYEEFKSHLRNKESTKTSKELYNKFVSYTENKIEERAIPPETLAYDIGSAFSSIAASVGLASIGVNSAVIGSLYGIMAKSSMYAESREAGKSPQEAEMISNAVGGFEAALEGVGLNIFLNKIKGSSVIVRTAIRTGEQGLQEALQQASESTIANIAGVRKESLNEIFSQIGYSAALGVLTGAPVSAVYTTSENTGILKIMRDAGLSDGQSKGIIDTINNAVKENGVNEVQKIVNEISDSLSDSDQVLDILQEIAEQTKDAVVGEPYVVKGSEYEAVAKMKVKSELREQIEAAGEGGVRALKMLAQPISTRLADIHPAIATKLRRHEFDTKKSIQADESVLAPFAKKYKTIPEAERRQLSLALMNSDLGVIMRICQKYDMVNEYAQVKELMDDVFKRAEEAGIEIGYRENYWARKVKPSQVDKYLEYLRSKGQASDIDRALEQRKDTIGRELTKEEETELVNNYLRGFTFDKVNLAKPGQAKTRTVGAVTAEGSQFYVDSLEAVSDYIIGINEAIASKKFFGKGMETGSKSDFIKKEKLLIRVGDDVIDFGKPQGLYLSIGETTLIEDIEGPRYYFKIKPVNPLKVDEFYDVKHSRGRGRAIEASSGIKALKEMVPIKEFEELLGMKKNDLIEMLSEKYKDVEWGRYSDSYEILEGYAGKLARENGYDSIIGDSEEIVILDNSIIEKQYTESELDDIVGRGVDNREASIGDLILDLKDKYGLNKEQERELSTILNARFTQRGAQGIFAMYRDIEYMMTMGHFYSALTQFGDLYGSIYKSGVAETARAFADAITKQSDVTFQDLGLDSIAEEFASVSCTSKIVNEIFKITQLSFVDRVGKETFVNAYLSSLKKKTAEDFAKEFKDVLGDDAAQTYRDLQAGNITDDVVFLGFNALADFQPIAMSEMPVGYLKAGNWRLAYSLKSYALRTIDVYNREAFRRIAKGGDEAKEGFKNLFRLAGLLLAINVPIDVIKSMLQGKEIEFKDLPGMAAETLMKLFFINRYSVDKAKKDGIGDVIISTLSPSAATLNALSKDTVKIWNTITAGKKDRRAKIEKLSDLNIIRRSPFLGDLATLEKNLIDAANEKKRKKKRRIY